MPDDSMIGLRLDRVGADYQRTRPAEPPESRDNITRQLVTRLRALQAEQHAASADCRDHTRAADTEESAARRHWHAGEARRALAKSVGLVPQIRDLQAAITDRRPR